MLINKINNKELVAGVIGLGYVGLPLAVEIAKVGYKTIGFDVESKKVQMINDGISYIKDILIDDFRKVIYSKKLIATNDFSFIKELDFITICVPTPLNKHKEPDTSYITDSITQISRYLKRNTMIVLESTTYPGTTEELVMPILEKNSGMKCGEDFYLAFSPERVNPGNVEYKTHNTPKVIGGVGEESTKLIAHMYRQVIKGVLLKYQHLEWRRCKRY